MTRIQSGFFRCAAAVLLLCAGLRSAVADLPSLTEPAAAVTTPGLSRVISRDDSLVTSTQHRDTGLTYALLLKDPQTTSTEDDAMEFDPNTMMRVEDLRPGTKGYGLSVFSGIKPERFEAELVGVRHGVMAGMDIILCRLKHPILEDIGVVAGMSGSPVYMDGKLIGAVAYGWTNTIEALAGVTPIDHMLKVWKSTPTGPVDFDKEEGESDATTYHAYNAYMEARKNLELGGLSKTFGRLPSSSFEIDARELPADMRDQMNLPDRVEMRPLTTPIFVSGLSPKTYEIMRQLFDGMDLQPTGGMEPVSTWSPSAPAQNAPGGPVPDLQALANEFGGGYGLAVPFIEGDLSMAGVGTVTFRKGDRLVAFGHPMFEYGLVRFPMAPARINAIVRSNVRPFKVGESVGQIGMIRQDRQPAVGGVFGQTADMFEATATVNDPKYRGRRDFKFRLWNDREMAPRLAMSALVESIISSSRSGGEAVALYRYNVTFDDGTSVTREDYLSDESGALMAAMGTGMDLGVIMTNPYKRVKPRSLHFEVQVADRLSQAQIMGATANKETFRPGETVQVEWEVQPYRTPLASMKYSFVLPENIPDGTYTMQVTDGRLRDMLETRRHPGGDRIFDYESLVDVLTRQFPANKVYVTLQDRDTGVAVRGQEMPKLPASIINTVEATVDTPYFSPVRGNFLVDADITSAYEISGSASVSFEVKRKP